MLILISYFEGNLLLKEFKKSKNNICFKGDTKNKIFEKINWQINSSLLNKISLAT